jgi:co-chaperonin GroES (HSP10)
MSEPARMKHVFPLNKRILIKANDVQTRTLSGIIVESGTGDESRTAHVIECGPDVEHVKPGYTIYVMWTKALPVRIGGFDYSFINEEDVVAILDKV